MAYVEMGSVFFRGHLKGAIGAAKFKLTAQAIDAVDGINIRNGSVSSYVITSSAGPVIVPDGGIYLSAEINGDSSDDLIDVVAYADADDETGFFLNGTRRVSRNRRYSIRNDLLMYRGLFKLQAGSNIAQLVNVSGGDLIINRGILMLGYIRRTGLYA